MCGRTGSSISSSSDANASTRGAGVDDARRDRRARGDRGDGRGARGAGAAGAAEHARGDRSARVAATRERGERTRLRRHGRARITVQRRRREDVHVVDVEIERLDAAASAADAHRGGVGRTRSDAQVDARVDTARRDGGAVLGERGFGNDVDAAVWEGVTYRGGGVL